MLRYIALIGMIVAGLIATQLPSPSPPPQDYSSSALHTLSAAQLDQHLRFLGTAEPDPVVRLQRLAEQSIGQPHEAAVLGEGQYDAADPRPLYALDRSDNAGFVEQTLAMAVASDFESFFLVLQRLRYLVHPVLRQGRPTHPNVGV